MIISGEKLSIPSVQKGGKDTLVEMRVQTFADDRAIGVFKLHPDNTGASDIAHVRRDIVDGLTQVLPEVAPRDFRYFEDTGIGESRFKERTFDRDSQGQVFETKPVGMSAESGLSQKQFDDIVESYGNRENRLMAGQGWSNNIKLPNDPNF